MNVTIDRGEDIRLLQLILGGKDGAQQAGSARHGLRITRGGNFDATSVNGGQARAATAGSLMTPDSPRSRATTWSWIHA
jgi:hypothetical protein